MPDRVKRILKQKKILMVHGLNDTGKIFNTMSIYFQKQGYQTHTIDLKPNGGTGDLQELAGQVKQYVDKNFPPEEKIILVGFSMGGLVTRYYLQRLNGREKVNKYVSISAPNNGSILAYFLPFKGIQQMRPHSNFLQDLNKDVQEQLSSLDSIVFWTPLDTMIVPAKSSLMGIGKEISIPIQIHKWMSRDKRVLEQINDFLQD